eukprot:Blabericola_migrator_1__4512@NODE_2404_length_2816_cov_136_219716_g1507_i0_p2_GENE_NODE_2404_length_2816_cov_136_219716_g1507_i0NODE_2404_length_2816_cov_136_219716_g1507_i0_p2_ORF_typecomplete_len348_score22_07NIF/PF03031_18/1_1e49_NODE_2404_length_2816_cov_136_219716_g1507_i012292272
MAGSERTRRLGNFFCCRGNTRPGSPDPVRQPKQSTWDNDRHSFNPSDTSDSDLLINQDASRPSRNVGGGRSHRQSQNTNRKSRERHRYKSRDSASLRGNDEDITHSDTSNDHSEAGGHKLVTQVPKDTRLALFPQLAEEDLQDLLRLHEQFKGPLLGPQRPSERGKKTLVLDLDETLVHSSFQPVALAAFVIPVEIESLTYEIYVAKRPGVDEFLSFCTELYEVVIFTASVGKYAGPLLDKIDPEKRCPWRLYRDACLLWQGNYIKDLSKLGRDLKDVLIVDNSPASSILQPDNAIPIRSWFDDQSDRELYELMPILRALSRVDDIQAVMRRTATCESLDSDEGGLV